MKVRKHSGEMANYSRKKLTHSLLKSGIAENEV